MTVIATMIAQSGTAHSTDSLITRRKLNGAQEIVGTRAAKVIGIRRLRGAVAYWGYAGTLSGFSTLDWLKKQVATVRNGETPERFAERLAKGLQAWLVMQNIATDPRFGIGLHFTAYEQVDGDYIPELFLISNFNDPTYSKLRPEGVGYSRETFSTITAIPRSPEDRQPERRRVVKEFLAAGNWLRFNNGDPSLFNPTADSVARMLAVARARGVLATIDHERLAKWTRLPIEMVSALQRDFYRAGVRIVGGRIHDLCVTPSGQFFSTSGDTP